MCILDKVFLGLCGRRVNNTETPSSDDGDIIEPFHARMEREQIQDAQKTL